MHTNALCRLMGKHWTQILMTERRRSTFLYRMLAVSLCQGQDGSACRAPIVAFAADIMLCRFRIRGMCWQMNRVGISEMEKRRTSWTVPLTLHGDQKPAP